MTIKVSDFAANRNETIETAAVSIGRSIARQKVFSYIYRSKARFKPVSEIAKATGLSRVRVAQEAVKLHAHDVVEKGKLGNETAYRKNSTLSHYKDRILKTARNPKNSRKYPTKQRPHGTTTVTTTIRLKSPSLAPRLITVDDVDSFKLVRGVASSKLKLSQKPESAVKSAIQKIIGETNNFTDWGGEKNDLFTNKLVRRGNRTTAAFALKGRATQGPLTPKKMGANGDQIGRLLSSSAEVFFVVYHSKVDESVFELIRVHALGASMTGRRVFLWGDRRERFGTSCSSLSKAVPVSAFFLCSPLNYGSRGFNR